MSGFNLSRRWLLTARVFALLTAPCLAGAQGTGIISGTVTDSAGAPLASARVSVDGTSIATGTNALGRFTLAGVTSGAHTVRARVLGYREQQLPVSVTG